MSDKRIQVGDKVEVWLGTTSDSVIIGTVLAMPQATGDCWVIEAPRSIHHVQTFCQAVKWLDEPAIRQEAM